MRKNIALLALLTGLLIYIGLVAWTFMIVPEPRRLLPAIAHEWIGQSLQIQNVGFSFAFMPLWCLAIHWRVHNDMPDIKQYLMTYSVINAPALITAGYLAYQLHSPDCLTTCPAELQLTLIYVCFFASVITAISLSLLLRLKQGQKA